jgi:hypothetical protein
MKPRILRLAVRARRNASGSAERVSGELFLAERGVHNIDHEGSRRPKIGLADISGEDGKQRSRVRKQQALAPIDPEHVRIPVLIVRRVLDARDVAHIQQVKQPCSAGSPTRG